MRTTARAALCGSLAITMLVAADAPAQAQGYVEARSLFGNGVVRGSVRRTDRGRQVQLPSGAWIYCERSCTETLRAHTVDFWEAQTSPGAQPQGLGVYLRHW